MKPVIFFMIIFCLVGCTAHPGGGLSEPVQISNSTRQASCVYLTSAPDGTPVMSWCEKDSTSGGKQFFMSWFDEHNKIFGQASAIPIRQDASIHEEGMPKIAVKGDGTVFAIYETAEPTPENKFAGFVYYQISQDSGRTWSKPEYLSSDHRSGTSISFASLARLSDGEIGACWLGAGMQQGVEGRPVYFAKTDSQNHFTNETLIDPAACECCRTAIASSNDGSVNIVFRDLSPQSVRDIAVSQSADQGKSFSPARSFSKDGWQISGCPHNGPALVCTNKGPVAVWYTGGNRPGIYLGRLDKQERLVDKQLLSANGRFAQLCVLPNQETIVVYNTLTNHGENVESPVFVEKWTGEKGYRAQVTERNKTASYPVIAAVSDSIVVVAWKSDGKIFYQMVNIADIRQPVDLTKDIQAKSIPAIRPAIARYTGCEPAQ